MADIDNDEEDTIHTQHLTLNVLNIVPNMGGVPLVWAVALLGSAMIGAVIGFASLNDPRGLLFGLPSLIIFFIVKLICLNSMDSLRVFQLKVAGKFQRLKSGGGVYQISPSLEPENGESEIHEQIKRAKQQA
ncbi:conjugal transfer protein TraD [Escherichia coli]|jgi:hypothetical protein|uniref:Conjugal transfer protein TraD n=2 Tax=Enterobacterales TaxID=91347 RepID=B2VAS2_ERWT9|nr:hypothetical protein [Erwinia tasmaniensis]EBP7231727.1 conjugal transfer protein TraD [Salmonella enterica]EFG1053656.1 conjugal transfer protein TraD [Escherichia coli]ECL1354309.1 conjugal transfer protein TraD [Salmonella enterica]EKD1851878.1 conjugal transfer protein TraD [Salmonella enterica]CAO94806.1 Putative conjugal transfer protein TraD [Erwinia tasmaniensis Et1/99]